MDNNSQKDELQVEQYDASSVEEKRYRILKRVVVAGAAILAVLGAFGLVRVGLFVHELMNMEIMGGSGAWYSSVVIHTEEDSRG